jgi:hypothetical protein
MERLEVERADELQRLSRALEAVERRVQALEGMLASAAAPRTEWVPVSPPKAEPPVSAPALLLTGADASRAPTDSSQADAPSHSSAGLSPVLALVGRTLVVLGGAYLLRALTDAGVLAPALGVTLGLGYAALWLGATTAAPTSVGAVFHALAATLIAMPLVWEATFRFDLLGSATASGVLASFAVAALVAAIRRGVEQVAWLGAGAPALLAVALAVGTHGYLAPALFLILLGLGTLWLGYVYDWLYLRWPIAGLATLLVAGVTARAGAGLEPVAALLLQAVFLAGYLGSFAARTLFVGRAVVPFEVVQSVVVLIVGFGGAVHVASASGANVGALGLFALAMGLSTYAVAFAFVERHRPPPNFFFYASLALTFILVGGPLAGGTGAAAGAFAALAVLAAALAPRLARATLSLHGAAYALAAAVLSGLLGSASRALLAPAGAMGDAPPPMALLALVAVLLCALWPRPAAELYPTRQRLPGFLLLALGVWLAAGTSVALLAPVLLAPPGAGLDAGAVAAIRTVVLVAATLLLAWGSRHARLADGVWLVHPLLAMLALKLLAEDLPHGRPLTLMTGLAAYGAALILAPRLRQPLRSATLQSPSADPIHPLR